MRIRYRDYIIDTLFILPEQNTIIWKATSSVSNFPVLEGMVRMREHFLLAIINELVRKVNKI